MESSPSGLWRSLGKRVGAQASRGFESLTLRQNEYMDSQTIDTYNQLAQVYDDETKVFWDIFPREVFDKFSNLVQGRILDVGSGPGRDGLLLRERGLDVLCVDASETMVNMCKDRGLESLQVDFMNMPFEDEAFGGVWAYTSFLHVPKSEVLKALLESKRVLKKGGIMGVGMIEGEFEGYRESSSISLPRWFSFYTKEEIEALFLEAGLEIIYFGQHRLEGKTKDYLNYLLKK